ncbi:MAG: NDP-sugar synthase [Armatimonadota bacterium]|nr:NDP-sugar synthase [Armatimonadota bacterium]
MKGVIIAGGPGTRLRPLTYIRPKPIVPVVNKPFLEYQVDLLKRHGISDIIFCTNYMAEMIEAHFGDGSAHGVRMSYVIEENPLGTAGAVKNAEPLFKGDTLLVFNGDVLTDFDLSAIIDFHKKRKATVTLTLMGVPSPSPYGVIITDEQQRVLEFREPSEEVKKMLARNPNVEHTGTDYINAGTYVIESSIFEQIPADVPYSFERQLFPSLLAGGAPVYGYAAEGYWLDIGRPQQYMEAHRAVLAGSVKVHVAGRKAAKGYWVMSDGKADPVIDPTAHIGPTVHVGQRTRIEANATIAGIVSIGHDCVIGEGSTVENCVLLDKITVGGNVILKNSIVDSETVIEDNAVIEASCVLASNSRIGFGSAIC